MIRSIAAAMLSLAVTCAPSQRTPLSECLRYEPATVSLSGRFSTVQKYGPPNFGENPDSDERILVPLLVLSAPVDVCGDSTSDVNAETERGVKELQLLGDNLQQASLEERRVRIVGRLSHAQTGYHFTKVLLSVERLEPE